VKDQTGVGSFGIVGKKRSGGSAIRRWVGPLGAGGNMGLPCSVLLTSEYLRPALSTDGIASVPAHIGEDRTTHMTFWSKPVHHCGCPQ